MLYVLHHPNGALVLTAEDKEQVLDWGRRQLGTRAGLVSITETECMEILETVEKSGTGIRANGIDGCQPLGGIMANFSENLADADHDHRERDLCVGVQCRGSRKPTWH